MKNNTNKECFNFNKALELMKLGYFVTTEYFKKENSLHMYKGKIYFEDGQIYDDNDIYCFTYSKESPIFTVKAYPEQVDCLLLYYFHENGVDNFKDCMYFNYLNSFDRKQVIMPDEPTANKISTIFTAMKSIDESLIYFGRLGKDFEVNSCMRFDEIEDVIKKSKSLVKEYFYGKSYGSR